ncbi:Histidinol-phosphate aminotransferase [compost metagenome]
MRVGYAVARPEMTALLNRVRPVFNVNVLAQAAAVAALDDLAFLEETFHVNREGMAQLTQALDRLQLPSIPSAGNFLAVDFSGQALTAAQVFQGLLNAGFVVRPLSPYGLPDFLRITIGTAAQNAGLMVALEGLLAAEAGRACQS